MKTFGNFEFDDRRRGLTAHGQPIKLTGQAVELLYLLLERSGELITREEIERRLWPNRNVNFDHSLDVVVSRLRTVLGDKSPRPRYIETVPRRGYPVHRTGDGQARVSANECAAPLEAPPRNVRGRRDSRRSRRDPFCPHAVRQVRPVRTLADVTNAARPISAFV